MVDAIRNDINQFLDHIIRVSNLKIQKDPYLSRIKFIIPQKRCLARIWDVKSNYDINKQCGNKVFKSDICYSCLSKKKQFGLVTKYPTETNILEYYDKCLRKLAKKNPKYINRNVYDELNLNIYQKYISNKKILNNNKMNKHKLSTTITNNNPINDRTHKVPVKYCTSLYSSWWKSRFTDKVEIYDEFYSARYTFAMEETNMGSLLLNKNQVQLGLFRIWVDVHNTIPDCYKNSENQVLNPQTNIPLYEFIVNKTNKLYNSVRPSLYREYRYDNNKEEFVYTNSVKFDI